MTRRPEPKNLAKLALEQQGRLWSRCAIKTGPLPTRCWEWTGAVDKDGYGKFAITFPGDVKPKQYFLRAHQAAVLLITGKLPDPSSDEYVNHLCDNRRCCNPKHLGVGSAKANRQRQERNKVK
jgi:hypothetical protein